MLHLFPHINTKVRDYYDCATLNTYLNQRFIIVLWWSQSFRGFDFTQCFGIPKHSLTICLTCFFDVLGYQLSRSILLYDYSKSYCRLVCVFDLFGRLDVIAVIVFEYFFHQKIIDFNTKLTSLKMLYLTNIIYCLTIVKFKHVSFEG